MCFRFFPIPNGQKRAFIANILFPLYYVWGVCEYMAELESEGSNSSINVCHQTLKSNIQTQWRALHIIQRWWTLWRMELCDIFLEKSEGEMICINNWVARGEEIANHPLVIIHPFANISPLSLILSHESRNIKHISQLCFWLSGHSLTWIEASGDTCNTQVIC